MPYRPVEASCLLLVPYLTGTTSRDVRYFGGYTRDSWGHSDESFHDRIAKSKWVWHQKWTLVRFIFTISRYLPFVAIGMTFAAALRTQYYPGESCARYGTASNS
ncbi:hypothetical protein AZE42_10019 [Rhizopogon vesiculosus]|uniref:Uncharacterized protein n=1 Tax=Rhizopogon vesiculosus TaxID=180088 RepID=A0A1J8PNJ8_9AGAM|nr:hypothetical protein AZE42_10019 [Rhizopogon vesiculosus]